MLEIQKFIASHSDWREKLAVAPYFLTIKDDDGLTLFKYSQISSDFSQEICREARGLILEISEGGASKVIREAFKKFFNVDESWADDIDWATATATSKEDGSLMSLFYYDGKWKIATNNTIDAYKAPLQSGGYATFGDLFEVAAVNSGLNYSKLNPLHQYTFELCAAENRVVVPYDEPKLYHILTRDENLNEIEEDIDIEKPRVYDFNNEEEIRAIVDKMDENHEGVVVRDAHGNRVKIKTPLYFKLHRMANNGNMTKERALEIIMANEQSEFLSYFPSMKAYFFSVEEGYKNAKRDVEWVAFWAQKWKESNPDASRKDFAAWVQENVKRLSHIAFLAYDNKLEKAVERLDTAKKIMKFYHMEEE